MRNQLLLCCLALAAIARGQVDSNSITITANRIVPLPQDEAAFELTVVASPDAGFDEILGALKDAGLADARLQGVSDVTTAGKTTALRWSFYLAGRVITMRATVRSLAGAVVALNRRGMSLLYQNHGSIPSQQLPDLRRCPVTDLVVDARAQAQNVAAAAGVGVGPILALADSSVLPASQPVAYFIPSGAFFTTVPGCSIVVKFQMIRY